MSSNVFPIINNNKSILSPIFLDQLSFKLPIFTAPKENYKRSANAPKPPTPKLINDDVVNSFADPHLYYDRHNNVIHAFGEFVVLMNGARLYRVWKGISQAHAPFEKRRPKQKKIEQFEKFTNALSDAEKSDVCFSFASDPIHPYIDLLHLATTKLYKGYMVAIANEGVQSFNQNPLIPASRLERLELYLEISTKTVGMAAAKRAFERVLRQWLGPEKLGTGKVQFAQVNGEKEYLRWEVPQELISSEFNGERPFLIKLYEKDNGCIRVEIQANYPHIPTDQFMELDQLLDGWDVSCHAQKVAGIVAKSLRAIEAEAHRVLAGLPSRPSVDLLVDQMIERCLDLSPGRADKLKIRKLFHYIAEHGSIDVKTCRAMEVDPVALEKFAEPRFGFLEKRIRGVGEANKRKGRKNVVYILRTEWLKRSGQPKRRKSVELPLKFQKTLSSVAKSGRTEHLASYVDRNEGDQVSALAEARGSALSSALTKFLKLTAS